MIWSLISFQQEAEIPDVQTLPFTLQGALIPLQLKLWADLCRNRPDSSQLIIQVILMLMQYTNPLTVLHFVLPLTQKLTRKAIAVPWSCLILHEVNGRKIHYGQITPVVEGVPRLLNAFFKTSVYPQLYIHEPSFRICFQRSITYPIYTLLVLDKLHVLFYNPPHHFWRDCTKTLLFPEKWDQIWVSQNPVNITRLKQGEEDAHGFSYRQLEEL